MKKLSLKPVPAVILGVLAAVSATILIASTDSFAADDKKAGPVKPALTVTTTRPAAVKLPIKLAANGNVVAWQEAIIGSESGGLRLTEVRVNVGDVVMARDRPRGRRAAGLER